MKISYAEFLSSAARPKDKIKSGLPQIAVVGKSNVGKCDVEECDELAAEFGIRNIPTLLFFKNGQVVDKMVGAVSKAKLQEKFESIL